VEVSCKDPLDLVFFILMLFPNHATLSFFICWGVLVKDDKSDPLAGGYIVQMTMHVDPGHLMPCHNEVYHRHRRARALRRSQKESMLGIYESTMLHGVVLIPKTKRPELYFMEAHTCPLERQLLVRMYLCW
jgi:hypothetical protein